MIAAAKNHGVIETMETETSNQLDDLYEDYGPHQRFVSFEQPHNRKSFIKTEGKVAIAWEATIESNLVFQDIILWLILGCYIFLFIDFFIILLDKLQF